MSITPGHIFGWTKESELKPKLDELFGETLVKIEDRFSRWDFECENYLVELKSRQKPITPDTFETWLVPACKTEGLSKSLVIFYYFEMTEELFYIIYDTEDFKQFQKTTNRWGQLHYLIPKYNWTLV